MLESQKILLQLLKEIDDICRKNDITYYLVGGSALGAVRHHGFLPWDDDADIVMDHENYMKFVEVMSDPANMPPDRAYEDPFIEPYTQLNIFGRYSATDTTCIFDVLCLCDSAHGIKVDVFHLIPCPDEGPEREEFLRKFRVWGELCHPYARNRELDVDEWLSCLKKMDEEGVEIERRRLFDDLHVERYADSKQYLYCYEKINIFYDKDIFGEPVYFPFEDTCLPVPTKYKDHFRILFGDDWYCIPETSEQISHLVVQNEHKSYKEYTSDYYRYVTPEPNKLFRELKHRVYQGWEKQKEVNAKKTPLRKRVVEEKTKIMWAKYSDEIRKAFSDNDYERVLEIAAPYLDEQFSKYSVDQELFYEADRELFSYVVASFLYISKNKKARWLLYHAPDGYTNDEIEELRSLLKGKDMLIDLEDKEEEPSKIYEENELWLQKHNHDRDLLLRKAHCLLQMEPDANKEEICSICGSFPDDGDFTLLLAILSEKEGQAERAMELYKEAAQSTKNGLVILESKTAIERLKEEGNR